MKIYNNQNAGFVAINGIINNISADRKTMAIKSQVWDIQAKPSPKFVPTEKKVISPMPFDDSYQAGEEVSIIGYPKAGMITADHVFKRDGGYAEEIVTVNKDNKDVELGFGFVSGQVLFARVNEEKNADGSARLNQKNEPKKRHFDIAVKCENEAGEEMIHIIKVYDGKFTPASEKTPFEKYRDLFSKHPEDNCRVLIVTSALGERDIYSNEKEYNGQPQITTYANHMGVKSADFVFSKNLEKEQAKEAAKEQSAPEEEKAYEPTIPEETPVVTPDKDMRRPPLEDDYALE